MQCSTEQRNGSTMAQTHPRALLLENVHADADGALQAFGPLQVDRLSGSPDRALLEKEIATASVLGIRSRTQVDAALLDAAAAAGCRVFLHRHQSG
jgi:D-3-phosphoglycerate dehydrogenase